MKRKMGDRKKGDAKKARTEWPSIKPKSNLRITSLKDTDLFTVQNFFTSAESKAFVKAAESIGFVHQGSLGPTKGEAYRDNDRISVNDPVLAETIWESGLNKLFSDFKIRGKVAIGLNPNIRLYRYKVSQRFGQHIDESVDLGQGKRTHYTLLIYLSGGGGVKSKSKNDPSNPQDSSSKPLVGGETVFYGPRNGIVAEVPPTEGMALLHIHGDKCMLHEARNVTKGVKRCQGDFANSFIHRIFGQTPGEIKVIVLCTVGFALLNRSRQLPFPLLGWASFKEFLDSVPHCT